MDLRPRPPRLVLASQVRDEFARRLGARGVASCFVRPPPGAAAARAAYTHSSSHRHGRVADDVAISDWVHLARSRLVVQFSLGCADVAAADCHHRNISDWDSSFSKSAQVFGGVEQRAILGMSGLVKFRNAPAG